MGPNLRAISVAARGGYCCTGASGIFRKAKAGAAQRRAAAHDLGLSEEVALSEDDTSVADDESFGQLSSALAASSGAAAASAAAAAASEGEVVDIAGDSPSEEPPWRKDATQDGRGGPVQWWIRLRPGASSSSSEDAPDPTAAASSGPVAAAAAATSDEDFWGDLSGPVSGGKGTSGGGKGTGGSKGTSGGDNSGGGNDQDLWANFRPRSSAPAASARWRPSGYSDEWWRWSSAAAASDEWWGWSSASAPWPGSSFQDAPWRRPAQAEPPAPAAKAAPASRPVPWTSQSYWAERHGEDHVPSALRVLF
jgi:hypothetical protein